MKINQLKNKKILILGFAREGLSSYKFLRRHFKQQLIGVADSKTLKQFDEPYKQVLQQDKNLELFLGKNYLKALDKFEVIIKTPGIKLDEKLIKKLVQQNIVLTSNLNIFLANLQGKVIGVTGSKGKGTTATLIYKILKKAGKKTFLVGNIGQPFLDYLHQDGRRTIYVAELSSFHLEKIEGELDAGIMTSFFPEHLTYHSTVNKYFSAKMNLLAHLKPGGVFIYNQNYIRIRRAVERFKKIRTDIKFIGIPRFARDKFGLKPKLLGQHNWANIEAAMAAAKLFNIKSTIIKKTVENFKGLPYRLELVANVKGRRFYVDTLATTPESVIAAIDALQTVNLQTLIVGGVSKGGNYQPLARHIIKAKLPTVIMLPNVGRQIGRLIKQLKPKQLPLLVPVENMRQAVQQAFKLTPAGKAIALSPAGTSFDFYPNYAAKAEDFKRWVKKLKQ